MSEPRDVIARALFQIKGLGARYNLTVRQADEILTALHDAGYVVVKRAAITKPEPDWGRRGTQPKGTLGDPPPPNGKLVATKPVEPSRILADAFGEPDDIEEVAPNTFKYT